MDVTLKADPADREHVAHLRIDRPPVNAFTDPMIEEFRETLETVPDGVSVLTIAGAGPMDTAPGLTAGLDIDWARDLGPHDGYDHLRNAYDLMEAIRDLDAVVVCCCGEYALGAGFELASACEFRVATADATLGLPEVEVGLPTVIHGGLLLSLVGRGIANELIYLAETIDGERAEQLGILTAAPPVDEYADAVENLVDSLAAKSPAVLARQKRVLRRCRSNGLEAGIEASIGDAARTFGSPDQREAMQAFLEDRDPEFEGT